MSAVATTLQWDPKSTKCRQNADLSRKHLRLLWKPENANMEKRQVDWTFVLFMFVVILHFPNLAVRLSKNTWFVWLLRVRPKHRETLRGSALRNPVAAKMTKWRQHVDISRKPSCLLWKPDTRSFCYVFWLPFGSLYASFWLQLTPFCLTRYFPC